MLVFAVQRTGDDAKGLNQADNLDLK